MIFPQYDFSHPSIIIKTRKGFPNSEGRLSAIDKKSVHWSSSWARIPNVQDIIWEEPGRQVQIYLRRPFLPTCLRCTGYRGCRPTTEFRFNVGPALQPIAGSMSVNRLRCWPNTKLSPDLLYSLRKHVAFNQCCFNVDPQSSTLGRH